jgi:hypothetical protein
MCQYSGPILIHSDHNGTTVAVVGSGAVRAVGDGTQTVISGGNEPSYATYDNALDPDYIQYRWDAMSSLQTLQSMGEQAVTESGQSIGFWDEARTNRSGDWRMEQRLGTRDFMGETYTPDGSATLVLYNGRPGVRLPFGAGMTTMVTNKPVPWARTIFLVFRRFSVNPPPCDTHNMVDMSDLLDMNTLNMDTSGDRGAPHQLHN